MPVFESQPDVGQPIQGHRTHHLHAGNAVQLQFERQRDQALDFFGGVTGPLGDELDLRGGQVGIGVHRHPPERDDSGDHHEEGQHQHQEALTKRSLYDSMDHSGAGIVILIAIPLLLVLYRCRELANCRNKLPSPITRSPAFNPLVICVCPLHTLAECYRTSSKLIAVLFDVDERLVLGIAQNRGIGNRYRVRDGPCVHARHNVHVFLQLLSGISVSMRACNVRVFGSNAAAR